jgi:hypothetical protein
MVGDELEKILRKNPRGGVRAGDMAKISKRKIQK